MQETASLGDTVVARGPSGWKLASDLAVEQARLRRPYTSALLELEEPLSALAGPDIAALDMLALEVLKLVVGHLERVDAG